MEPVKHFKLTIIHNLVPRAFPLENGWVVPHPFFKGKALGTRLGYSMQRACACVPELEHMQTWHPDPEIRGWGGSLKKIFSALRASVWSKKSGDGGGPPLDPPLFTNFQLWTAD